MEVFMTRFYQIQLKSLFLSAFLIFAFLFTTQSVSAVDPVPGLDISLEQIPGGVVRTTKTDKLGNFAFNKLKAGSYELKIMHSTQKSQSHPSSMSNVKPTRISGNGTKDVSVSLELLPPAKGKKTEKHTLLLSRGASTKNEPIIVKISADGGKISGTVVNASAKVESIKK